MNNQSDAWTAHKTETGVVYYYNAVTGQSTYERPADFKGEVYTIILHMWFMSFHILFSSQLHLVLHI